MSFLIDSFKFAAGEVSYLLDAPFTADDQVFSDEQVLDTEAEGVQAGSLTVVDTSTGVVEISSNKLAATGTGGWAAAGVYATDAITRSRGVCLIQDFSVSAAKRLLFGFGSAANLLIANMEIGLEAGLSSNKLSYYSDTIDLAVGTYVIGSNQVAFVAGGYDSGTPWNGSAAGSSDGGAAFYKDGSNWILLYRAAEGTTNLYPILNARDAVDVTNIVVPDADLSELLEPEALDTSVSASDAFTHTADAVSEILLSALPTSGEIEVRFRSDWAITVNAAGDVKIIEDSDGTPTTRATSSGEATATSRIVWVMEDEQIDVYINDDVKISYASAAANKTETSGVVQSLGTAGAISHLASYPRGTGGEYSDLDNYPGAS